MAKKVYEESSIAAIAKKIRSHTGGDKKYTVAEMADGVDEAAEAAAEEKEAVTRALIDRSAAEFEVPYGVEVIGEYSIMSLNNLTKLTIPETVKKINSYGICNNSIIEKIKLPDSIEKIESNVLYSMIKLKELKLGSGLKSIGDGSLRSCRRIESYDFSASQAVPTLGSGCFVYNNDAFKIYVPMSLYDAWVAATNWAEYADHIVPSASEGLEYEYTEGGYMLKGRGSFEGEVLSIPEKHNGEQGEMAVLGIRFSSFLSDEKLTLVYVPSSIKYIDNDFCSGCTNLEKVYLPGVESVYSITLRNLTSLKYVKFGSGISDIGESAFNGCAAGAVYDFSAASNVPALNVFTPGEEFGTEPVIKVPAALYEEWKEDTNWLYYADYIVAAE